MTLPTDPDRLVDALLSEVLAAHDRMVEAHGESCDCETCLLVQQLADSALAIQAERR